MKSVFDEITLGNIQVQNRLVRSATFESGADAEGRYDQKMFDLYRKLADGGVGLIITGMVGVDANSRIAPSMVKTYNDTFTERLRQLTELVHDHGSRLVIQLAHCGIKVSKTDSGEPPLGISSLPGQNIREMSKEDLYRLADSFADAALRCKKAGADGVQMHAAHGYLLSQALSPIFNKRTDDYGGSLEKRAKLLFDVYKSIRDAVGDDYPVWIKINSSDLVDGGLTLDESQAICEQLSKAGMDAIEVSGGIAVSKESLPMKGVRDAQQEGYFYKEAVSIAGKVEADTDVISVGGYRTPELLERKLNEGNFKGFSLCRPFIVEPGLANRWRSGQMEKAKCISCNRCFAPGELSCKQRTV
ncbi:MAG: NADH:flavin oxidoreductase [Synergistaceae bacterium]|jgi:2,4-dienoyl-CoA reductase-like NADH-dependent reductase (Old Yellow Enzyme family)|nr:NADH:flavin oxidoreductase [Synergistaceae bacterium]